MTGYRETFVIFRINAECECCAPGRRTRETTIPAGRTMPLLDVLAYPHMVMPEDIEILALVTGDVTREKTDAARALVRSIA